MRESEQGGESPEAIYWGSWSEDPDPDPDEKRKPNIEGALRAAWEDAKNKGARPPFVLVTTEIYGNNPITDYKVGIKTKP